MTDGQLHVRQALIPEAQRRGLTLPSYYYSFHDLRKEAAAKANGAPAANVQDILNRMLTTTTTPQVEIEFCNKMFTISELGLDALKEDVPANGSPSSSAEVTNGDDDASAKEDPTGAKVEGDGGDEVDAIKKPPPPPPAPARTVFPPEKEVEGMARIVNKLICDGITRKFDSKRSLNLSYCWLIV